MSEAAPVHQFAVAPKMEPLIDDYTSRFLVAWGGRGGAKSFGFITIMLYRSLNKKLSIVCLRESLNTLADSCHALISNRIAEMGLSPYFDVGVSEIRCNLTGSSIRFSGLGVNPDSLRSREGADLIFVEEGSQISLKGWEVLLPTVRKRGSQIMIAFNPMNESDWVYDAFITNPQPDARVVEIQYYDNPWLTPELLAEAERLKKRDYEQYLHVWEGKTKSYSESVIFRGKFTVKAFPDSLMKSANRVAFGFDFGFGSDPCAASRSFLIGDTLYISDEVVRYKIDLDRIQDMLAELPGAKGAQIACDESQPGVIAMISKRGFNAVPAGKWAGLVEDANAALRGLERIVIHPRCKVAAKEFANYCRKVDKQTGRVLPQIIDGNDHVIDSIKYAWVLAGLITKTGSTLHKYEALANYMFTQDPETGEIIRVPKTAEVPVEDVRLAQLAGCAPGYDVGEAKVFDDEPGDGGLAETLKAMDVLLGVSVPVATPEPPPVPALPPPPPPPADNAALALPALLMADAEGFEIIVRNDNLRLQPIGRGSGRPPSVGLLAAMRTHDAAIKAVLGPTH